jgi:hypothetical protein
LKTARNEKAGKLLKKTIPRNHRFNTDNDLNDDPAETIHLVWRKVRFVVAVAADRKRRSQGASERGLRG